MANVKFGFKPSKPDHRDYIYGKIMGESTNLPKRFMFDRIPILEQRIGNCVGQSSRSIKKVQERINYPTKNLDFSPDFVYAICKKVDGIPNEEGTYPRVAMKVLQKYGAALEHLYPEQTDGIHLDDINQEALDNAKTYQIGAYAKIQTIDEIKQAIVNGSPVMAGLILTDNFLKPENGFVNLPEGYFIGGHAVALDGFDDDMTYTYKDGTTLKGFFRFINSWGSDYGDNGYGYLPYEWVNYSNDLGMKFFSEAWSSVDVILPTEDTDEMVLWIGKEKAIVNGKEVILDQPPVINPKTNRTLIPLRFIMENLGFKVNYDGKEKKITISK